MRTDSFIHLIPHYGLRELGAVTGISAQKAENLKCTDNSLWQNNEDVRKQNMDSDVWEV